MVLWFVPGEPTAKALPKGSRVISTTLAELGAVLPAVLDELRNRQLEGRPFVGVQEARRGGRFVQFGRVVRHAEPVPPTIAPIGEMGFDVPALGIYLEGFGNDPKEGTRLAIVALRQQGVSEGAPLRVFLDGEDLS